MLPSSPITVSDTLPRPVSESPGGASVASVNRSCFGASSGGQEGAWLRQKMQDDVHQLGLSRKLRVFIPDNGKVHITLRAKKYVPETSGFIVEDPKSWDQLFQTIKQQQGQLGAAMGKPLWDIA